MEKPMNQTERLLNAAADHIAATLEQPSDMRAWEQLLIYCPRTGARQMTPISPEYTRGDLIAMIHQRDALVSGLKEVCTTRAARIEALEAALSRVDAINDSPATFNQDIDDVVCAALAPEQDK